MGDGRKSDVNMTLLSGFILFVRADTRHVPRLTVVCEPVRVRWVDGLLARSGREITSLVDLAKDLRFVKLVEAVTNLDINSFVNKYRWKERKRLICKAIACLMKMGVLKT